MCAFLLSRRFSRMKLCFSLVPAMVKGALPHRQGGVLSDERGFAYDESERGRKK